MEETKEPVLKPGHKEKCIMKGWFIVNENGEKIYNIENPDEYVATFKRFNNVKVLSEKYSETAQKTIWKNTDEKNGTKFVSTIPKFDEK